MRAQREFAEEIGGKAVGEHRKRTVEHDAHHFPMAGHRILARRGFGHAADRRRTAWRNSWAGRRAQIDEAIQSQRPQRRDCQRHAPGNVPQRVTALVAVSRGIGQLADPHAVKDDDDGAAEWRGHARY